MSAGADTDPPPGQLSGVGVGPGDPELMTLKGRRVLAEADTVAYPAPERGESMARAIAAPHIPASATELPLRLAIDDPGADHGAAYDSFAEALAARLAAGERVALLCEGDPQLYGSFVYLHRRLNATWPVEIVPGVSSITAAAARLATPLAVGRTTLAVLPATLPAERLGAALVALDGAAVVKLGRHFDKLRAVLAETGLAGRAVYIERVGLAAERLRPLADVPSGQAPYFAICLIPPAEATP